MIEWDIKKPIHVIPVDDLIDHETSPECLCGPRSEQNGMLFVHHSLDGREFFEDDHTGPDMPVEKAK